MLRSRDMDAYLKNNYWSVIEERFCKIYEQLPLQVDNTEHNSMISKFN